MKKFTYLLIMCAFLALSACADNQDEAISKVFQEPDPAAESDLAQPPSNPTSMPTFDQTAAPVAGDKIVTMETTKGTIKIKLFPEKAPKTVENFMGLIEKGYYNGVIFHRVIPNFMIQGGDPLGSGMGGESLWGGKFEDELLPEVQNIRGSISMANSGPNTNGSQFFINQVDNLYLNGYDNGQKKHCGGMISCHTVFGQVFEGMDVVDAIASAPTGPNNKPAEDIKMTKLTVSTVE